MKKKKQPAEHLLIDDGPLSGRRLSVPEDGLYCGRDASCGLPIPDETLSRRHARLFFRAGLMWVSDLKSANGTLVNGQPVESVQLKRGDHVQLGNTRIQVLHDQLFPTVGLKERLARRRTGDTDTKAPAKGLTVLTGTLWAVLMAWWAFLAFSLCLPPPTELAPPVEEAPPPVALLPAPVPEPPPPAPVPVSAPITTPSPHEVLQPVFAHVGRRLLAEDFGGALDVIQAHSSAHPADAEQALLGELRAYVAAVSASGARVSEGLHAKAGGRLTLRLKGDKTAEVRVVAVTEKRLRAVVLGGEAEREVNLDIAKLHPADRLAWMAPPASPADHAVRAILSLRAGQREPARAAAAQAGLLAETLTALINASPRSPDPAS